MSSNGRPWYKWYPKDFNVDEKVQCLSAYAELIYRRALDVMWQTSTICLPNDKRLINQALGKNIPKGEFEAAWDEIMRPNWSLFSISDDGEWLFSKRLRQEYEDAINLSKLRKNASLKAVEARTSTKRQPKGKPKGKPNVNQTFTDTDTDTDIKEKNKEKKFSPPTLPEVIKYFFDNGYSIESAKKAFKYYSEANWKDSKGNQVRNWKQKMIAVWFKDENLAQAIQPSKKPITMKDVENGELERNPAV